jgi:WD40 repeat protein
VAASGPWLATVGYDNQVVLWDRASRSARSRAWHDHLANQCRFSSDGRHLYTASSDYTARRWSVPSLKLEAVFADHDDDVEMVAPHPTDGRVATASRDHRVRVFDSTGQLLTIAHGHKADALTVEWIAGGHQLLSSGDDGTIRRFDPETGRCLGVVDLGDVETDSVVHHDRFGRTIAGTDSGHLVVVDDTDHVQRVEAHEAGVKRVALDPGSGQLLTSSYDRTVRRWASTAGGLQPLGTFEVPPVVWLRAMAFVDDCAGAAFGTFGTSYAMLDLSTGRWDLDGIGPTPGLNAVRVVDGVTWTVGDAGLVSADGQLVANVESLCNFIGEIGGRVVTGGQVGELFEVPSGRRLHRHRSPLNCSATTEVDGRELLAVGTYTGEILVFEDGRDGLRHLDTLAAHDNAVKGLAVAGTSLFSVSATAATAVHDLRTGELIRLVPEAHDRIANGAALAGNRFVSVSRDLTLRSFTVDGRPLAVIRTPHQHSIKCVAAHPERPLVATGGYDGLVALYDLDGDRWLGIDRPTTSGISSIAFDPRTDGFVASSYDGAVHPVAVVDLVPG